MKYETEETFNHFLREIYEFRHVCLITKTNLYGSRNPDANRCGAPHKCWCAHDIHIQAHLWLHGRPVKHEQELKWHILCFDNQH